MGIHGQMYFRVEPPFVRPMASLPPVAPAAWKCAFTWLPSIISHSKSGSSTSTANSLSQTPLLRQRMKRRCVLLQPPNSGGRSRQGAPVRKIHNTALTKRRLSLAVPPQSPGLPGRWGESFSHTWSEMSCRCSAFSIDGRALSDN